ncbi:MAG TPA: hypothetical protein DEO68_16700 [Halomonas campaniensis]|uniref:Uncharacterized protein n=1 Tax=Halomonas campaniensis TaxID=213554 RepID=A0A3D0KJL8_9GAMM|nr:hypothetical protein [Halomonas campaniensis]HCA03757.1 hypothetical protein [Halomonas campaniensis]
MPDCGATVTSGLFLATPRHSLSQDITPYVCTTPGNPEHYDWVGHVRGAGLLWGIELVADGESRQRSTQPDAD